jgi:hypothetical protein
MDEGRVTVNEDLRYLSDRQTGIVRVPTPVRRARACTHCGLVEMYLDPGELKKKIEK